MNKFKRTTVERVMLWIVAVIAAVALGVSLYQPAEPIARSYNTDIYTEQGGSKMVVGSGGELEIQSGATLDIQSGATTDFSGGIDLDGASLVVDADGDTSIIASTDDVISITLGAATGDVSIDVGNLQVGHGSPGQTLDGDDFYVEGLAEIDGVAYLDGGADLNGVSLVVDADADTTIVASTDDVISITLGAAAGLVSIDIGNLSVGHGSPDQSLDGDDLYVEGTAEVDGVAYLDGGIDLSSATLTMDTDADTTIVASTDDVISITLGAAAGLVSIDIGNLSVGHGSPGQSLDGDDLYVEGLAEIDGVLYADGGADLNGTTLTVDADADTTIIASTDDVISITLGAAAGIVSVDTGNLSVGHGAPSQALDGDDLYVKGQTEVDGSAWFDGIVTLGGLLKFSFNDRATSDGDTITPTYTIYSLDTSGAVTITLAASASEGQLLVLVNDDANACVIADTNLMSSDGNAISLSGADDWVVFIYQDDKWHEIAKSANS